MCECQDAACTSNLANFMNLLRSPSMRSAYTPAVRSARRAGENKQFHSMHASHSLQSGSVQRRDHRSRAWLSWLKIESGESIVADGSESDDFLLDSWAGRLPQHTRPPLARIGRSPRMRRRAFVAHGASVSRAPLNHRPNQRRFELLGASLGRRRRT